jgi:hypothetical protein
MTCWPFSSAFQLEWTIWDYLFISNEFQFMSFKASFFSLAAYSSNSNMSNLDKNWNLFIYFQISSAIFLQECREMSMQMDYLQVSNRDNHNRTAIQVSNWIIGWYCRIEKCRILSNLSFQKIATAWWEINVSVDQQELLVSSLTLIFLTSNLVRAIHCSDKRRGGRVCTVWYDVYSNSPFSKCVISLMCTFFYIRVHAVKVDWADQNEQYLISQSIVTSDEWYTSLGTILPWTIRPFCFSFYFRLHSRRDQSFLSSL